MEAGFLVAQSDNLPEVDLFMIMQFLATDLSYLSAEIKGFKNERAGNANYIDNAIGYVQLKRDLHTKVCTVKAKISPEHKIKQKPYDVEVNILEEPGNHKILSSICHSCTASLGGCKHAVAFLHWLLKKSDEPSRTSVDCYWTKSTMSKIGTDVGKMRVEDFLKAGPSNLEEANFREVLLPLLEDAHDVCIVDYHRCDKTKEISLHHLMCTHMSTNPQINAPDFLEYAKSKMTKAAIMEVERQTKNQSDTSLWSEMRYGRITASKLYEASKCKTPEGALFEQIMGGVSIRSSAAMERGKVLEKEVVAEVAKQRNLKIKQCGLFLNEEYPMLGASPDGITKDYVIEIKCPSAEKTEKNYYSGDAIANKFLAQIQLQMKFAKKNKGLFIVASPNFETTKSFKIFEIIYNDDFINNVIKDAIRFWELSIFPKLCYSSK